MDVVGLLELVELAGVSSVGRVGGVCRVSKVRRGVSWVSSKVSRRVSSRVGGFSSM